MPNYLQMTTKERLEWLLTKFSDKLEKTSITIMSEHGNTWCLTINPGNREIYLETEEGEVIAGNGILELLIRALKQTIVGEMVFDDGAIIRWMKHGLVREVQFQVMDKFTTNEFNYDMLEAIEQILKLAQIYWKPPF